MELVELRSRAELDKALDEANGEDGNLNDARNATGMKKKGGVAKIILPDNLLNFFVLQLQHPVPKLSFCAQPWIQSL